MFPDAATIEREAHRLAALQAHVGRVLAYRQSGQEDIAEFLDRPQVERDYLLARQDIADAVAAANAGDEHGTVQATTSVIERQMRGTRLAPRRKLKG